MSISASPTSDTTTAAAAVFDVTRRALGPDWLVRPGFLRPLHAEIRSRRGHQIELHGVADGLIFATAILPNGERSTFSRRPAADTAEAYGLALAKLVTGSLAPSHDAVCPVLRFQGFLNAALDERERTTYWEFGNVHTAWHLLGGGRARADARRAVPRSPQDTRQGGDGVDATVTFADLTPEQATAVLGAIDLTNRDPRQHAPVYGEAAQQIKAAAPALRPIDTYNWPRLGGKFTVSLTVDNRAKVEIISPAQGPTFTVTVYGNTANQIASVRAL